MRSLLSLVQSHAPSSTAKRPILQLTGAVTSLTVGEAWMSDCCVAAQKSQQSFPFFSRRFCIWCDPWPCFLNQDERLLCRRRGKGVKVYVWGMFQCCLDLLAALSQTGCKVNVQFLLWIGTPLSIRAYFIFLTFHWREQLLDWEVR